MSACDRIQRFDRYLRDLRPTCSSITTLYAQLQSHFNSFYEVQSYNSF